MTKILIILAVVAVIAALLLTRRSGPRITRIETRRDTDRDEDSGA